MDEPRGAWIKWLLIAVGWSVFAIFFASEAIVTRAYAGRPLQVSQSIAVWFICAAIWLAATPLILHLARQFPIDRRSWLRNSLVHVALSCGFSFLLLAIYVFITSWIGLQPAGNSLLRNLRNQYIVSFHSEVLTYWAVIGLSHAVNYYRKYREREIRASQLEAQLARAQLDALRMQLQPHFLFNTLNTISVLMKENVELANNLLLRLSDLLRLALRSTENHEVTLREELEFLRNYLEIEQTRFQDRLTVRYDIDDRAVEAQVPNLILQPLVENAIRHAVAPKPGKSTLEIRAARRNGKLELQVVDDGPGLTAGSTNGKGIGLRNTRSRLDKLYGTAHTFQMSPANGKGLQVTVTLPFHITARGERINAKDQSAAG
ncbi:MAG TPA: histidine kinase [Pyrinomonadaceae bacterium]